MKVNSSPITKEKKRVIEGDINTHVIKVVSFYSLKTKKKIISDAIAHLNGYAVLCKSSTGWNPVSVLETIKKLEKLRKDLK